MMISNTIYIVLIILFLIIFYYNKYYIYNTSQKNTQTNHISNIDKFNNISQNNNDIYKKDEILIRNMINLPNRNPQLLTSKMVYPEAKNNTLNRPSHDETRRSTRMDVLNMFYNNDYNNINL